MHLCDNRLCVNPDHLRIGTHATNCADKVSKGRQAKGEDAGNSKLTNQNVRFIKQFIADGLSNAFLAKQYGVSAMCISRIRAGKTWRHL